jgi:hypothetical protein
MRQNSRLLQIHKFSIATSNALQDESCAPASARATLYFSGLNLHRRFDAFLVFGRPAGARPGMFRSAAPAGG